MRRILVFTLVLACAGCTMMKPLKPGTARIQSGVSTNGARSFISEMKQPENPAQSAAQNYERTTETELPLPKGTQLHEKYSRPDLHGDDVVSERTIVLTAPTAQKTRVTER